MEYANIVSGIFRARPNRFIAHVEMDGQLEIVHVKNTGRCRELLQPGVTVWCEKAKNPDRKTKYDLIAVQKGERLINMDSQAPNAAVCEWLEKGGLGQIQKLRPETFYGDSRFDFCVQAGDATHYVEVKGVTLEENGAVRFPDAPTERGVKHIDELVSCLDEGYEAYILFVVQMKEVEVFRTNDEMHKAFGDALRRAASLGVKVIAMDCIVTPDSMMIDKPIKVEL